MFDADLSNPQTRWLPGLFEAEPDTLRRQLDESRGPADQRLKFAEYAAHLTEAVPNQCPGLASGVVAVASGHVHERAEWLAAL